MPEAKLCMVMDGPPPASVVHSFSRIFTGGHCLVEASTLFHLISDADSGLKRFCREHVYGRKLLSVIAFSKFHPILYTDADILVFKRPEKLLQHLESGECCYNAETAPSYDPVVVERANLLGWPLQTNINAGLITAVPGVLDQKSLSLLLKDWPWPEPHRYSEQAAVASLLSRNKASPLPIKDYVTSWQGMWPWERDIDYNQVVLRHFYGVVRHRMYLTGMPLIWKQIRHHVSEGRYLNP